MSSTSLQDALSNLPFAPTLRNRALLIFKENHVFTIKDALVTHTSNPCFFRELLYPMLSVDELENILMYLCALEIPSKSDWVYSAGVISTYVPCIDNLLSEGFLQGAVYEICGEAGGGKSTIAMQTCIQAVASGFSALYFTVEKFSYTRLKQLIEGRATLQETDFPVVGNLLDRFILCRIPDWQTLFMRLETLEALIETARAKNTSLRIIVIDSMAALQCVDYDAYSNGCTILKNAEIQEYMQKFALAIQHLCAKYAITALLINQVRGVNGFTLPALGYHWAKGISTRLLLLKNKVSGKREIKVAYSTYLVPKVANFGLDNFGIMSYSDC